MITDMERVKADNDGVFPSYAWPGGYPLYYLTDGNDCLCPTCANKEHFSEIVAYDANWEDEELYCDECNSLIESVYEK